VHSSATQAQELNAIEFVNQMKAGWNLGNSLDSHYGDPTGDANLSQETIWGNPKVTKELIDYVKSQGFDVIRVPVSWYTHTYRDANGTIHISPEWMNRVHEVVDYCISDNLYVIINTHHDGTLFHCGVSDNDFKQVKADAVSIWNEIASSFASYDQRLIFEAYNEVDNLDKPWAYGDKAASQMNELNQIFVDTVRATGANNDSRLLMVPTLLDAYSIKFQKSFVLPKDITKGKLIVTVHDYTERFDQTIENVFINISALSKSTGAPVIIGEWGTTNSFSPTSYRSVHASNYIARASKYGLKCIYWDNGSNYGIIDRKSLTSNTALITAIMNPSEHVSNAASTLNDIDKFVYMSINQTTGHLRDDKHWGTIMVNTNGKGGYDIPAGKSSIYVGLVANDNMSEQRIHYIYFFDANDNITGMVNDAAGFTEKAVDIPADTVYARIGINSSYSRTSKKAYKEALSKGKLCLMINFY
jgi:aryl-phospho-beta-D-glucosidase BglC (GH1 family)